MRKPIKQMFTEEINSLNDRILKNEHTDDMVNFTSEMFSLLNYKLQSVSISKYIEELSEHKTMSTATYEALKDILKILATDDNVNLSKYDGLISFDSGKKHKELIFKHRRNSITEFSIILQKIDVDGTMKLIEILLKS